MKYIGQLFAISETRERKAIASDVPIEAEDEIGAQEKLYAEHWDPQFTANHYVAVAEVRATS